MTSQSEAGDGEMSEALQGPGDIDTCGQVTGRLGQQDGPGFHGLRSGEGGLHLGEQRSQLVSLGRGGQPGGEPERREGPLFLRRPGHRRGPRHGWVVEGQRGPSEVQVIAG